MTKIFIDPGHGGNDPGAVGNGLEEKNVTLEIAQRVRDSLQEYEGVEIQMSRTGDQTISLEDRVTQANSWGADYFVSIHINAGGGTGYEDYIHSSLSDSSQTAQLRDIMHEEIISQLDFRNRGKKKANFHVLRETRNSAILTENGFIDNVEDAQKLKSSSFLDSIAQGHVNGIVRCFNLNLRPNSYIVTGGLSNSLLASISDFLKQNQIIGDIRFNGGGTNPRLYTGLLNYDQLIFMKNWLDDRGWYYNVTTSQSNHPPQSGSQYIQTGGLNNSFLSVVSDYMKQNQLRGDIRFNGAGTNPVLITVPLSNPPLSELRSWLDQRGWYYRVITV